MPRRVISIEIGLHKTKIVEVSFKKKILIYTTALHLRHQSMYMKMGI